jgi:hypothetical protein
MAMRVTINGVDVAGGICSVPGATIGPLKNNELSPAHFQFLDGAAPNRGDTLVAYAPDGVTPIYGGIVRKRTATAYAPHLTEMFTDCDIDDWWVYLDTSVPTSRVYGAPVTMKQALVDVVNDCGLAAIGFTVDPAQVTGPTFPAFGWPATGAAEAVRRLSTWATSGSVSYVAQISPSKVIRMFIPGTDPAPFTITDAAPHCEEVGWADPDALPYTKVALWCGPAGPMDYRQSWVQAGAATAWVADIPAANGLTAGYVTVGGINKTVNVYGEADPASFGWEWQTRTLHLGTDPVPADGTVMEFVYAAASPFLVTSGTGAIVSTSSDETILTLADGQRTADGLYARLSQGAITWAIVSHDHGWLPGQGVAVHLSAPAVNQTLTISDVTIRWDASGVWKYAIAAVESVVYQGSPADQWRALGVGVAGGPAAPATIGGDGGGGGSGGMLALPAGQIYVGSPSNTAAAVPMSGDINITAAGVTTIAASAIGNAEIVAGAGITDDKLATISTAGKVANSATSGTAAAVANTLMLRDANADFAAHLAELPFIRSPLSPATDLQITSSGGTTLSPATRLLLQPAEHVWMKPASAVVMDTGAKLIIPALNYTQNLGRPFQKFLTLHAAELWVETLVAQQTMATIGGRILVGPTTMLARDLAPGDTTIYVKHNSFLLGQAGVEYGSKLYMESGGQFEAMQVTVFPVSDGGTGPPVQEADGSYAYTVQRDLDGSGANAWWAGDAVFDTGKKGSGFIDLYSVRGVLSGYGPTIVGNVRTKSDPYGLYTDIVPRWAIGNLDGLYGYSGTVFGAAFGDNAAAWLKIDPTNGVRLGFAGTVVTQIDAAGNASFSGTVTAGGGKIGGWSILPNYLFAPATNTSIAFNSSVPSIEIGDPRPQGFGYAAAGIWMGNEGGVYKFRACSADGLRGFFWDGTVATFRGDGAGVTNINGGNIQTDTITATQIAAGAVTAAEIAARSITADRIVIGALTATEIASRTITADRIVAGALTATEIASRTITGDRIVAGAITTNEMSVGQLSAITSNLGTVTAGQISGVTIYAGTGNEVRLDGSGITITASGLGANSRIKWTDGSHVIGNGGQMLVRGAGSGVVLDSGGSTGYALLDTGALTLMSGTELRIQNLQGGSNRQVWVDGSGRLFA